MRARMPDPREALERNLSLAIGALALVLYVVTLRLDPRPGASAHLMSKHLWLDPFPLFTSPVWGICCRGIHLLAGAKAVAVLHMANLALAVVVVLVFFRVQRSLLRMAWPRHATTVNVLGAAAATLFLCCSTPFWYLATKPHPMLLGVFLFLCALFFLARYHAAGRYGALLGFGVLYGLGIVEYPLFWFLALPLGLYTGLLMWRRRHADARHVAGALAAVAGGLLVSVPATWQALASPANTWMEDQSFIMMTRIQWVKMAKSLPGQIPRTGWLVIGITTVLPWLYCQVEARRKEPEVVWPPILMHAALWVVCLLVLFNAPIASWHLLGERRLVIFPTLLSASTFGFVFVYLYHAAHRNARDLTHRAIRLRAAALALVPGVLVAAPAFTGRPVLPGPTQALYRCAAVVAEAAEDRRWLVTDGSLDALIRLAALREDIDLTLLSLPESLNSRYRKFLASEFTDPRQRALAGLGLLPLLRDWIQTDDAAGEALAIQNSGLLWNRPGLTALPDRLIYLGARSDDAPDADEWIDRHVRFWEAVIPDLWRAEQDERTGLHLLARHWRWHASRVANDMGVFWQGQDRPDLGRLSYKAAIEVNHRNASALVNLRSAGDEEYANRVAGDDVLEELRRALPDLVGRHGEIRELATLWDLRGQDQAVATDEMAAFRADLLEAVRMYQSGDLDVSFEQADALVKQQPHNAHAWFLRGLLALLREEEDEWEKSWDFMVVQDAIWPSYFVVKGQRLLQEGRIEEGMNLLHTAYENGPFNLPIVRSVALMAFVHEQEPLLSAYLGRLLSLEPSDPWGNFILGTRAFQEDDYQSAESSLRVAIESLRIPAVFNNLAWLLVERGAYDEAKQHLQTALQLNPRFLPAWDTVGVLHTRQEDYEAARKALTYVLKARPGSWETKLHLAQLSYLEGKHDDARVLAVELETDRPDQPDVLQEEFAELRKKLRDALGG